MRKIFSAELFLILGVGLIGGFAWLTHHPDTPWLEDAETLPVVGTLAKEFRQYYLGLEDSASTAGAPEGADAEARTDAVEVVVIQEGMSPGRPESGGRPIVGSPATDAEIAEIRAAAKLAEQHQAEATRARAKRSSPAAEPAEPIYTVGASTLASNSNSPSLVTPPVSKPSQSRNARREPPRAKIPLEAEWRWFLPGQEVYSSSGHEAQLLHRLNALSYLPVLDRDGFWVEVVYNGQHGWIDSTWEPPFKRRKSHRGIVRQKTELVRDSNPAILRKLRKVLGKPTKRKLGPYTLYTDVTDEELLVFLESAAAKAEDAYFARYGRLPSGYPNHAAALFASREAYVAYTSDGEDDKVTSVGHAGGGVLVLYAERASRVDLARTLVHEIGHLLNNRALAYRLPPWLEEGLASDLGSVWVESSHEIARDDLLGNQSILIVQGAAMRLRFVQELLGKERLPSLDQLWRYDNSTYVRDGFASYAYAHGVSFVRYMLDGDGGQHAAAFRGFLKKIAGGQAPDPRLLVKLLEIGGDDLESDFRAWVERQEIWVEDGAVRIVSR